MTIELSKLGERFENAAGWIQNLAEENVGGVAVIFSKAGSRRSDHWHRSDNHELFVVSGRMEYYERPVGSEEKPVHRTINAGEMVFTGPNIEHATLFPVDTVLISLSRRARTHELHEQDLVRLAAPLPTE